MSDKIVLADIKNFEEFFMEHHHAMVLYAYKFVRDKDLAMDIVQDAFTRLWESRNEVLIKVSVTAYLYKTVYNLCLNHIEQQKLHSQHHQAISLELREKELDYFNGETSLLQKETASVIASAVKELPEDYKQVVEMSRFEGLKNKEIAEKLNIPQRTVETRIYRAINKLRDSLRDFVNKN
ncbi:RNA polymerase sigma-70 factor [Carboxylicivirga sp. N1Y90]|uniref:RNA polymerase sigma-70 factor n=1 Tax=Carboxylicivirga fragile TaxID=3417571 RepID=UPI003D33C6D0|nr:RNA polymerase sigma-70 factor [Marinilabiliaceae bacterium N1Y90]